VLGAFLVRRALSPVERITNTARSIEENSDLNQRVHYNGPPDEIGRLAMTFNHMIEHLHQVFQSQKRFVADASHDMRIPLTVIKGNQDLLIRNPDRADRMEALNAIGTETNRMMDIATSLLTLAGIEDGQVSIKELVPLHEILLEEYQRALQVAERRKIRFSCNEELYIKGDNQRIRRLLENLLDNALRYTPDEGTITLSLSREKGWACLQVSDTGIGISPEHLPNIFNPFYRTDKARSRDGGGVGLGLAIVKGIVYQHGGRITVTSCLGEGSTFTARFKL
jgi:signal transduction histidine kinase